MTPVGLDPSADGTHSMRWTKVTQIHEKTRNLCAVQLRAIRVRRREHKLLNRTIIH